MSEPTGPIDIYARRSAKGDKEQVSVLGQIEVCRDVLADRGLPVGEVFKDDGDSAWNPKVDRKDFERLMARMESGASAGVCVFDLERFSRQPLEGERLIAAAARGLLVIDSDQQLDLSTTSGKQSFRNALAGAAAYSDRLSDRVKRGKARKARSGKLDRAGPQDRPFGWEDDGITQRPAEIEVIRVISTHLLHGDPQDRWCARLNAAGITTSQGNPFRPTGLRELILRERNRGNLVHLGVVVAKLPGEPALDDETFTRLQTMYAARRTGRPFSPTYLSTGFAVCSCGHQLAGRPVARRRPYDDGQPAREYRCMKHGNGRPGGCGLVYIDQRDLDEAVAALSIAILSDPRHAAQVEAAAARHTEAATALDSMIAADEATALEIGGRLGRGEMTLARHDAIMGPLDKRLGELRQRRQAVGSTDLDYGGRDLPESGTDWAERWSVAIPEERRDLLRLALRGRKLIVAAGPGTAVSRLSLGPPQR